jgi:ribose transport system substrate-binding protein
LAGTVKFVGFDSSPKLVQALQQGHIHALVLQNPLKMGYLGVKQIVYHLKGLEIESLIDTGVYIATRENMDDPDIKALLEPDFSSYLER